VKILRTIQGKDRQYQPGKRADTTAFEREFGGNAANLKRLEGLGAISLEGPKDVKKQKSATVKGRRAPKRTRTKKTADK